MPRTIQTKPYDSTTTSTVSKNKSKGGKKKIAPTKSGITKKTTNTAAAAARSKTKSRRGNTRKTSKPTTSEKKKTDKKEDGKQRKTRTANKKQTKSGDMATAVTTKKRRSKGHLSFGAIHMELQYQKQISNATKLLERPVCKGIESPIAIMKDGLARGAVLFRADILRANKNAMAALSRCLSLEHKKLARLLYSIKVVKYLDQQKHRDGEETSLSSLSQPVSPRIKDRHVKQAYEQMGIIYLA